MNSPTMNRPAPEMHELIAPILAEAMLFVADDGPQPQRGADVVAVVDRCVDYVLTHMPATAPPVTRADVEIVWLCLSLMAMANA